MFEICGLDFSLHKQKTVSKTEINLPLSASHRSLNAFWTTLTIFIMLPLATSGRSGAYFDTQEVKCVICWQMFGTFPTLASEVCEELFFKHLEVTDVSKEKDPGNFISSWHDPPFKVVYISTKDWINMADCDSMELSQSLSLSVRHDETLLFL